MLVSVIMPVYNGGEYLKESIESILNQTYKELEFIIIDDGSTDSSKVIIEEYQQKDKRIKFISRENRGLVKTLNELIEMTKGNYIFRMDADDIAHKRRVEKQLLCFKKGYDLVATSIDILCEDNNITDLNLITKKGFNKKIEETLMDHIFKAGGFLCHPTIAFTREMLNRINGYSELCYVAEDLELYLRIAKIDVKFIKLEECLLKYRVNNFSKSEIELEDVENLKDYMNLKLKYIKEGYSLNYKNVLIWGKGHGGYILKSLLEKEYESTIYMIDKNTSKVEKEKLLNNSDLDCILIGSQIGKFEIIKEIRMEYPELEEKYFCIF